MLTKHLAQNDTYISHLKGELDETRRGNQCLGNQRQFKDELSEYENPRGDKVCSNAEIEDKFNNNTTILDKLMSNHRSPEDKTDLGFDRTYENSVTTITFQFQVNRMQFIRGLRR